MNLIDRHMSLMPVLRRRLQLLGVVAMFVASKFEEIDPPRASETRTRRARTGAGGMEGVGRLGGLTRPERRCFRENVLNMSAYRTGGYYGTSSYINRQLHVNYIISR